MSTDAAAGPVERAEALLAVGRHADAVPWLERAIAADPQAVEPRCLLALTFDKLGRHRQALEAADRAVAAAPDHEWPHRLRALALLRVGRKVDALAAAREAVRLAPELPEVYVMRGRVELALGDTEAARSAAERAVNLAPEEAYTHAFLGLALLESGQLAQAEAHYRRALALDPESFEAMNNLGVVLQQQGREREAMDQFLQAARLDPTSQTAQGNLIGSVDRHLSPAVAVSRPVQIGLLLVSLLLPPVRLLLLIWSLMNVVIRWSKLRALPPTVQTVYRLERRSRSSWAVGLLLVGAIGTLVFGLPGLIILLSQGTTYGPNGLLVLAGVFLLVALAAGARLLRRRNE